MDSPKASPFPFLHPRGRSRSLIVLAHGYTLDPRSLDGLAKVLGDAFPDADLFIPKLPVQNPFTTLEATSISQHLASQLELAYDQSKTKAGYEEIYLVGHSLGALLIRRAYSLAWEQKLAWAGKVQRIVLLAALNRGWTISHHLRISTLLVWNVSRLLGTLWELIRQRELLIFSIRRGGSFIAELQLAWLEMRRQQTASKAQSPTTIQLLGSVDDMVSPEDNIDLVTGGEFLYLDVPHSGHLNILEMDTSVAGGIRKQILIAAIKEPLEQLKQRAIHPSDEMRLQPRLDVTDVVFVVHGIRDVGYWTHKIARKVQALGAKHQRRFATRTSSYGYFPMLPFVLPFTRKGKVQWLVDQYVQAKALYPEAEFSYVGHSNGTYMLARALEQYPEIRFKHVVFAGSVVRKRYPWRQALERGQVQAILNYIASSDWVVAWFPKLFQTLAVQDLGSAGHDGFLDLSAEDPRLLQIGYVPGAHSAALVEENWDAIAHFIVLGTDPKKQPTVPQVQRKEHRFWPVWLLGRAPILVWAILILGIAKFYIWLFSVGDLSLKSLCGFGIHVAKQLYAFDPIAFFRIAVALATAWLIKLIMTRL